MTYALSAQTVFDGSTTQQDMAVLIEASRIARILPISDLPAGTKLTHYDGLLAPGFVDLQVNGGGGVMFNETPTRKALQIMATAHLRAGATTILPTLITSATDEQAAAVDAVEAAIADGEAGLAGLHLEGPHLARSRKGAHCGDLLKPLEQRHLETYFEAARRVPLLKITVAPEQVTKSYIRELVAQGVLVFLGHSDASFADAKAAALAGAYGVTHLFNAMSQMQGRAPGLVGAALELGGLSVGLIADGHHVDPTMVRLAVRAKRGPGQIFLVSDSMATAGTDLPGFMMDGQWVTRDNDRLTQADGTLAGAHLSLDRAVGNLVRWGAAPQDQALAMATRIPADLIGRADIGRIAPGARADLVLLDQDTMRLKQVWQGGVPIEN